MEGTNGVLLFSSLVILGTMLLELINPGEVAPTMEDGMDLEHIVKKVMKINT